MSALPPSTGWRKPSTKRLFILASLLSLTCFISAFTQTPRASASTQQFCNYTVAAFEVCPPQPLGIRHTYNANFAWMYNGCFMDTAMYVAYTNSNASSPKYHAVGYCQSVADSFPNNTELLRPYAWHETHDLYDVVYGEAYY